MLMAFYFHNFQSVQFVASVAAVRALFQALESIEPDSSVNVTSLQSRVWEAFEISLFKEYSDQPISGGECSKLVIEVELFMT
jgi:hypothetical protein